VTRDDLLERLRAILVSEFELTADQVTEQARLVEDLDLDSIDGVSIVVRVESQLGIVLTDEEIAAMSTVGDVLDALEQRLGGASRA